MAMGLLILPGEQVRNSLDSMRNAGLWSVGTSLNVAKKNGRKPPHRRQLAAHVAADPQPVVGGQSLERVFVAPRRLAQPNERICRLQRPRAARGDERVV